MCFTKEPTVRVRNPIPRNKRNTSVDSNASLRSISVRYRLLSTISGFANTAMKGMVEATPAVSTRVTITSNTNTSRESQRSLRSKIA